MTEERNTEDRTDSGLAPEGKVESPIDMDQARFLAMCIASESSAIYGWRFRKVAMALEIVGADERADDYLVTLSFRPQGQFGGAPGLQEISIAKEGNVAGRRVVRLPESPAKRRVPVPLIGIGLAVVGVVVAAGVFAAVRSGGNESSSSEILSASTVVPATASPVVTTPNVPVVLPPASSPGAVVKATIAPAASAAMTATVEPPIAPAGLEPKSSSTATRSPATERIDVTIEPSKVTLEADTSQELEAQAVGGAGQPLIDSVRAWQLSSQAGVISQDGVLTAGTKAGVFAAALQVDVSHGGGTGSATADVIIEPGPLDKIEIQPASVSVFVGESVQLTAVAYDRFDIVIENIELSWESGAGLTIDQTGKVTYEPKASAGLPSGLVAWWPGDGNGEDVVGDNNGALTGGAGFATAIFGQGFRMDGENDHVMVAPDPSLNLRSDVTVHVWAKRTKFGGQHVMVVKGAGVRGAIDVPTAFVLKFSGSRLSDSGDFLAAGFERSDGSDVFLVGPEVTDQEFHHYAYVRNAAEHKLFLDGKVVVRESFIGGPGDTFDVSLAIGTGTTLQAVNMFAGVIDEVKIFSRALSDKEIRDVYEDGSSSGGGAYEVTVRASYKGNERVAMATVDVE